MVNNVAGINEAKIDSLILEIYDYEESIKKILNGIDDLVQENIQYFGLELGNEILGFHKELRASFPVVTQNIASYVTDLINLKKHYSVATNNVQLDFSHQEHK